jgi:hypothetical protein
VLPTSGINLRPLFRDFTFGNSQDHVGLQLADTVASTFHRTCKGALQKVGWRDFGSLFLDLRGMVNVVLLGSGPDNIEVADPQVRDAIMTIRRGARSPYIE